MGVSAETYVGSVLDRHEAELVDEVFAIVEQRLPEDAAVLVGLMRELKATSDLLKRQRSLRAPTALGGDVRDEQTLIDHLCRLDGLSGDLGIPLKATLSRTYLLTKINFLRGFMKSTRALGDLPRGVRMTRDLRDELVQTIYTLLAEELLLALLRKPDVTLKTKQRAAGQLITVWDDAMLEIDDFAPSLESAWHARNRVSGAYGALIGGTATFRLIAQYCPQEVLEFFGRAMTAEEAAALDEFLFNMTSEELAKLRVAMKEQQLMAATPAWAAEVLGRPIEELERFHEIDPMALYRSYQRRQLAADFRLVSGAPGPRRTAEGYLMVHLLDQK